MIMVYRAWRFGQALAQRSALSRSICRLVTTACLIIILEGLIRRFGFFYERQAVWWPTNGLCVALLLRTERRKWPWILGGAC